MPLIRILLLAALFSLAVTGQAEGQHLPVGDPMERYLRLHPLDPAQAPLPSFTLRPVGLSGETHEAIRSVGHPWQEHPDFQPRGASDERTVGYRLYHPELTATWNSSYPFGQNDGALWQGRGVNSSFAAGGEIRMGPLEISLRPEVGYSRNRDFDLSPVRARHEVFGFAYPAGFAPDLPQRFGEDPVSWVHPGRSTVQLQRWGIAAGVSTANIWMGPAMDNPLVMSNNAPGFLHGFVGTTRPLVTPVGSFETRLYWGELKQSDYFHGSDNNPRFATGLLFAWSPSFISGLTLGFTRTHYEYWPEDGLTRNHLMRVFATDFTGRTEEKPTSQMISLFGRWTFPDYGLEAWFEWGLNDGRPQARMLPVIFEHSRAYNLGLMKRFDLPGNRWLALQFEMTELEHERTLHSFSAASGIWYEHSLRRQGWTHQGQLLGAGIGVGSNNQLLRADLYGRRGAVGLSVNRVELHNDKLRRNLSTIRRTIEEQYPDKPELAELPMRELQTTEFRFGAHTVLFLPWRLELQADLTQARQLNRYHMPGNHTWNTNLAFTLRYRIGGGLR